MPKKKSRPALHAMAAASRSETAEAVYFARKCGLTPDEALRMIREAQQISEPKTPAREKRKR
ncbi:MULTISPECIES: hypothetical protein [unclassified Mesorhizobium]|uniref:hypothetical protein n=1 Tax=unclassified Mesorhizobium TaxID=325217 RepID=UPI000BAFCBA4|nr:MULTISPECIES: hypothetical protein [unclassified Mesorhizobium]TGT56821.1 hypothetical protein EN813_041095 [Mesorhizobium sp. M00.F.Ca.ET.170.01.1.1]AZO08589.1 hypothetical protein EJ074_05200 [Mesorhizobium sp. M3A.F.Ca.ET.080.04.2.1]PBB85467.1 hypothetical protein CK216_17580 [Mesorhizobium sp. WSM3876]RWB71706.1 MAG: hypothetical protein EOQ49_14410 [Mesorhizobium sp.]RWB85042.1 MAG: hypothetical protein EOQ52_22500 [Mesorhizobium sp.]